MDSSLAEKRCKPCEGGEEPLKGEALDALTRELGGGWSVVDQHHLEKTCKFKDFAGALAFTNRVGAVAEEQGHHPDICLSYGKVKITVWTHKIGGLSQNDFIFAAKADAVL